MKNVKPFVDLGWFIVPLSGQITRLKDGSKQLPPFPKWKEKYLETPYEPEQNDIAITGAVITGKRSGVVSVDCDNANTYNMFRALDPDNEFVFVSKGKVGGSIMYWWAEEMDELESFRIKNDDIQLDFQNNDLLQFLPTSGNRSKVEWKQEDFTELPELKKMPDTVFSLLKTLKEMNKRASAIVNKDGMVTNAMADKHYRYLAPFLESFLRQQVFIPELFRILTPATGGFRELPQYLREKTLHPDNVPEGLGNAYLSSVAGVLVTDSSVSAKMFTQVMIAINNMWSNPLPKERLAQFIQYEATRERWDYDENWKEKVTLILTEYNTVVSIYYDPLTRIYYALDNRFGMTTFNSVDMLPKHINSIVKGGRQFKTADMYTYMEQKRTIMSALEPYGDLEPEDENTTLARYNLFQRSEAYDILLKPELYADKFRGKKPENTLRFFEHLIPDQETRDYVLKFVYTKLVTLEFSEVILYFLGKQGAGKNLFVDWLAKITENKAQHSNNSEYNLVVEVDLENFLSKYNLWILNSLFANLDEYGEKTSGINEDKRVLATLKSYSGKSQIQLRTMNNDPIPAEHKCTFILTANENRLSPDLEDRRLVMIDTPKPLADTAFVQEVGGKGIFVDLLFEEIPLWCYYWATNYGKLDLNDYRTPPSTEFKRKLIIRHLPASKRIVAAVDTQHVGMMIEMCEDHDLLEELLSDGRHGFVSKALLKTLFEAMTEGTSARKTMLDRAMRDAGMVATKARIPDRGNIYALSFPALKQWANQYIMSEQGDLLAEDSDRGLDL